MIGLTCKIRLTCRYRLCFDLVLYTITYYYLLYIISIINPDGLFRSLEYSIRIPRYSSVHMYTRVPQTGVIQD